MVIFHCFPHFCIFRTSHFIIREWSKGIDSAREIMREVLHLPVCSSEGNEMGI